MHVYYKKMLLSCGIFVCAFDFSDFFFKFSHNAARVEEEKKNHSVAFINGYNITAYYDII